MEKIVFLDIDGTLCDKGGNVPESAKKAIENARENGHKVFLCTGRSTSEINENIKKIGFDGIVAGAGAYVECNEKEIFHTILDGEELKKLIQYMLQENILFVLERNEGCMVTKDGLQMLDRVLKEGQVFEEEVRKEFINSMIICDNPLTVRNVNKILYFNSEKSLEELKNQFADCFTILPSSIEAMGARSGEISDKNINKATGIKKVLDFYNKTRNDVIAIGDGMNDIEMIQYAGIGIAMENGQEHVKQMADYVARTVNEDGIYESFKRYGLIQ